MGTVLKQKVDQNPGILFKSAGDYIASMIAQSEELIKAFSDSDSDHAVSGELDKDKSALVDNLMVSSYLLMTAFTGISIVYAVMSSKKQDRLSDEASALALGMIVQKINLPRAREISDMIISMNNSKSDGTKPAFRAASRQAEEFLASVDLSKDEQAWNDGLVLAKQAELLSDRLSFSMNRQTQGKFEKGAFDMMAVGDAANNIEELNQAIGSQDVPSLQRAITNAQKYIGTVDKAMAVDAVVLPEAVLSQAQKYRGWLAEHDPGAIELRQLESVLNSAAPEDLKAGVLNDLMPEVESYFVNYFPQALSELGIASNKGDYAILTGDDRVDDLIKKAEELQKWFVDNNHGAVLPALVLNIAISSELRGQLRYDLLTTAINGAQDFIKRNDRAVIDPAELVKFLDDFANEGREGISRVDIPTSTGKRIVLELGENGGGFSFIATPKYGMDTAKNLGSPLKEQFDDRRVTLSISRGKGANTLTVTREISEASDISKIVSTESRTFEIPERKEIENRDAAVTNDKAVGGINLNPAMLEMQIKRDGNGFMLPLEEQPLMQMDVDGFAPVILQITPVTNLPLMLGVAIPDGQDNAPDANSLSKAKVEEA
jgi:preprotein translocase subunit SecG